MNGSITSTNPSSEPRTIVLVKEIKLTQKRTNELLNRLQNVATRIEIYVAMPGVNEEKPSNPNSLVSALSILQHDADNMNDWLQSLIVHLEELI